MCINYFRYLVFRRHYKWIEQLVEFGAITEIQRGTKYSKHKILKGTLIPPDVQTP